MSDTLLPPNATGLERAVEDVLAPRLEAIAADGVRTVNDPAACPAEVLPFLAWSRSVDVDSPSASVETRRAMAAEAPAVHRRKGTPASIEAALAAMGLAGHTEERVGARRYDGATRHDGIALHGPDSGWALYRVRLTTPLRNDQVDTVRRLLDATAAKHCELISLDYREVANLYDGRSHHDGAYNHGSAT